MLFFDLFRHDPKLQEIPAGQTLFREGDMGETMYVLVAGHAEVSTNDLLLEEVGPGAILGEMGVIEPGPRSATVTTRTACTFAVIDQKRFRFLVDETPRFAIEVMGAMARRLRQCDERLRAVAAPALDET
jgi:CRP-like cAMP-binding protein